MNERLQLHPDPREHRPPAIESALHARWFKQRSGAGLLGAPDREPQPMLAAELAGRLVAATLKNFLV
ncbi:hypothetical protein ACP4OV_028842 [Aristida adscensionis]